VDLSVLPTLSALAVFVGCFRPLVRRAGPQTDACFVAWTFLLIHYVVLLLPNGDTLRDSIGVLVSIWAVELCGLCFMWAACNARSTHTNQILTFELGIPILFQSFLYVFNFDGYTIRLTATLLLLIPALHLLIVPLYRSRALNRIAGAFALLAVGLIPFTRADSYIVLNVIQCALFLSASYLIFTFTPKVTRGTVLMVGGMVVWALTYLLQGIGWVESNVHLNRALLDFPRYVTAAGMVLSLLDEYVGRTESLALHDPLTGLPNRRLFENRLDEAIEESRRTHTPIACLVIDVDNFKYINDTHGHPVGDGLLQALAKRLSWNLGPRDMLARTGGDEFTAVLVEAADEYHVRFIAGAMMAAGCIPVSIQQHSIDVRISIGIAVSPQDADDSTELHKAADDAMYRAKRRGGSIVAFANEEVPQIHAV